MNARQLQKLSVAYDLDGGGHEFTRAPSALGSAVVVWDDPDWDYLPFERPSDYYRRSSHMMAFAPNEGHGAPHEFPESFQCSNGDVMVRLEEFTSYTSEHTCTCHGRVVPWTGAAGEPAKPLTPKKVLAYIEAGVKVRKSQITQSLMFEHTGDTDHHPFPDCARCGGDGLIESVGGAWALYVEEDEDEDEDN